VEIAQGEQRTNLARKLDAVRVPEEVRSRLSPYLLRTIRTRSRAFRGETKVPSVRATAFFFSEKF